ncbi:MAG: S41 family peptidase [Candidatus Omnitrophota bacterium]
MRKRIFIGIILCGLIFLFVSIRISGAQKVEKKDKIQNDLFRQVELFSDSLAIIKMEYVDEVSAKDLIYGALKGMLSSLDSHSQFMDPDTYNELKVDTEGKFGGLGIEITIKDGLLTVITPIEDTPAWKADIKAGDRIVKINNELTRDMTLTDAVKKMRGAVGEQIILGVLRESEKKILEFKIIRDIIKIKAVKDPRILEDGIGYIRLVEFREETLHEFNTALGSLYKQGMNALVLDLRNNPGGLLESAVRVSEKFIEPGKLIVYTKGRKVSQNLEFFSRVKDPIIDVPIVILINEGSASGSEIVAGCLQDYKRAILVGTKSFGKGSVQTIVPLSDGSALRLTTSKYFTPLGQQIHGKGVMPDIIVENGILAPKSPSDADADKEKIKDVFDNIEKQPQDQPADGKSNVQVFDYKSDSQLMRAVDILKALRIFKNK